MSIENEQLDTFVAVGVAICIKSLISDRAYNPLFVFVPNLVMSRNYLSGKA